MPGLKINLNLRFCSYTKLSMKREVSTGDWLHYSLVGPWTSLHMLLKHSDLLTLSQQTPSATFICCSKFYC